MNIITKALTLCFIIGLIGCAQKEVLPPELSEEELYREAQRNLDDENFGQAVRNLQLLEARFPFGPYAEQAQLEIIYANFRNFAPDAAIADADRFIRLHPQHPNVDYAYYMRGLANYIGDQGFFDRFLPTDNTQRDPGASLQAFEDFRQLLIRFPDSPYAADAKARMTFLNARLARHEINVANYYFKRKAYIAAANRGRYVVENYSQTPAAADGLAVMIQAYQLLGTNDLANDTLDVLRTNFPSHPSLDSNGNFKSEVNIGGVERSWLNRASFGLFDRAAPPKFDNRVEYLKN